MKKQKFTTKVLAEVAIFAALAFALDALQGGMWRGVFVNGGSIGLAMLPILVISYRRGLVPGLLCGLIVSLVQMLGGIYVINASNYEGAMKVLGPFFQIGLDYVLAYTVVGFAGAFHFLFEKEEDIKSKIIWIIVGTVVAGLLKYMCHVLAGGFFWLGDGSDAFMGVNNATWAYSFVYNGAYSIPNIILCTGIMVLIAKLYPQFLKVNDTLITKEEAIDAEATTIKEDNVNE